MATRTKPQFEALYGTSGTTFNDNTTGDISAGDMRTFGQDIADSVFTSGIISSKVTVSSASILTAFTTPLTLVAAQGAGTFIEIHGVTLFLDYNSVGYATNTTILIQMGSTTFYTIGGVLPNTVDTIIPYIGTTSVGAAANTALTLTVQTGNPTAGNSPLYVYVTYRVITL